MTRSAPKRSGASRNTRPSSCSVVGGSPVVPVDSIFNVLLPPKQAARSCYTSGAPRSVRCPASSSSWESHTDRGRLGSLSRRSSFVTKPLCNDSAKTSSKSFPKSPVGSRSASSSRLVTKANFLASSYSVIYAKSGDKNWTSAERLCLSWDENGISESSR